MSLRETSTTTAAGAASQTRRHARHALERSSAHSTDDRPAGASQLQCDSRAGCTVRVTAASGGSTRAKSAGSNSRCVRCVTITIRKSGASSKSLACRSLIIAMPIRPNRSTCRRSLPSHAHRRRGSEGRASGAPAAASRPRCDGLPRADPPLHGLLVDRREAPAARVVVARWTTSKVLCAHGRALSCGRCVGGA